MDDLITGQPGEPAPDQPAPPAPSANIDQPTGTPADTIGTGDNDSLPPELEQQLAEWFEQRTGQPAEPAPGEPAPQPEPSAPAQSSAEQPVESAATDQTTTPPPSESTAPTQPTVPETVKIGEQDVPLSQLTDLYQWAAQITPEQAAAIEAVLTGQAVVQPAQQFTQPQPPPAQASPTGTPTPSQLVDVPAASGSGAPSPGAAPTAPGTAVPDLPDLGALGDLVPELRDYLTSLASTIKQQADELALARAQQAQIAQTQAAEFQRQQEAALEAGFNSFSEAHPELTEDDLSRLTDITARLQIVPALVQQHQGDVARAFQNALETALWYDPSFRQKAIQSQLDQFAQINAETEEKKRRNAALAGTSGQAPRTPAITPDSQLNPEQRKKAMVDMIAAEMAGRSNGAG